ncbi:MAG: hypothetical protein ACD_71C00160G0001 [uncultured bacterium (gcode 4)]|uniref:Uncharacterized protein n=1 Tax=uncultured bacterium (gcode 4) TaxID=1234023 RepID=K1YN26_9BACT|nr:MAG: hypothetical protein ACD_71C00160G0001 [uncultured bacterium (gcode 4)]
MNECLSPFLHPVRALQLRKFECNRDVIYINPFGSLENKTLDLDFVINLCKEFAKDNKRTINIICGLRGSAFQSLWVKRFSESGIFKNNNILTSFYSSLDNLVIDIYKLRPEIMITADTSIAHLANYLNINCIILCNSSRVDNSSMQSMISESPLGFGRYFLNNYPFLVQKYDNQLISLILNLTTFLSDGFGSNKRKERRMYDFLKVELKRMLPTYFFCSNMPEIYHNRTRKMLKEVSPVTKLEKIWKKSNQ